jgi:hypothetical protein
MQEEQKEIQIKQVGVPTVTSAVFRGSDEFEDFWCDRSVTVPHSVTVCVTSISFPN